MLNCQLEFFLLVSSSLNQLHSNIVMEQPNDSVIDSNTTLPFHEQVKNSAAHLVTGQKVTVVPDSDVNVIGTNCVRIQVSRNTVWEYLLT